MFGPSKHGLSPNKYCLWIAPSVWIAMHSGMQMHTHKLACASVISMVLPPISLKLEDHSEPEDRVTYTANSLKAILA